MKLKIRNKLLIGFGIMLFLMLIVGLVGWLNVSTLKSDLDENQDHLNETIALANAETELWQLRYGFPQYIVLGHEKRAQIVADEPQHYQIINENIQRYSAGNLTLEERQVLKEFQEIFAKYIASRPQWFHLQNEGKTEEAAQWRTETTSPFGAGSVQALQRLIELSRQSGSTQVLADKKRAETLETISISLLLFALPIGIFLGFLISRGITRPLIKAVSVADQVSKGNLSAEIAVQSNDNTETGQLMNAMGSMTEYLKEMATVSDSIADGNLSAEVKPRSADDRFGNSFQKMAISINREITERKQSEQALFERERLALMISELTLTLIQNDSLSNILRSCAEVMVNRLDAAFARIWTLSDDGKMLELQASAGLYTHLDGAHSRVPVGKFKIGLIAEERQPHLTNDVAGDPRVGDKEWAKREGMVAFAGYPLIVGGQLVGVVAMFARQPLTDVTFKALESVACTIGMGIERRQATSKLIELASIVESSGDAIYSQTLDSVITNWNSGTELLYGYTFEEIMGRKLFLLFPPDKIKEEKEMVGRIMRGERVDNYETIRIRKDGTHINISLTVSPLRDDDGNIVGIAKIARDITARKQMETAVKLNEKRMAEAQRSAHLGSWELDIVQNKVIWSDELCRIFGLTPQEYDGTYEGYLEYVHPDDLELVKNTVKKAIREKKYPDYDHRILTRNGDVRVVHANGMVMVNENGATVKMTGTLQDITERVRIENALRQSEEKYREFIENANDIIYTHDLSGVFTSLNRAGEQFSGYTQAEALQMNVADIISTKDVKRMRRRIVESIKGMELPGFELEIISKDGSKIMMDINSRLILKDGVPVGSQGIGRNITERTNAEKALRQAEQKYESLFSNAITGIYQTTLDGNYTAANPMLAQMFGYDSPEEMIKEVTGERSLKRQFYVEEGRREEFALLIREHGILTGFESEIYTRDGRRMWIAEHALAIRNESGQIAGFQGTTIDITERKRIEEELEQTRDVALESARLKSEFLANMSHEIRTPMNGVIGMTGLLLDTNLNEEQRDYAQTVQSSADGLLRIIDDILDFSKIEAGQLHFEQIDFDLRECVESTIEQLAERAQSKGIEIASLVYRDVPTLLCGDPGRLRQILTNLIGNAVKFTEKGEVTVNVRKQSDADKYVSLRFEVTDTGIGISEQVQRKLFQAFVQADGSTTRKFGGTGLGLAISKQLVEMMGGDIGIESAPGKGATFWFTARFEKQASPTFPIQMMNEVTLEGVRVLIVDDNATNRKIFLHQTDSWGMIAAEADSGKQALQMLLTAANREPFEIAILDLMMPEMDGFELARAIKSDPVLSGIHLLLLPSYGKRGDGQIARDFGIAAYIQKPVRQSQLYNCLMTVIAEASGSGGERQSPRLITQHSLRSITPSNYESKVAVSKALILVAEDNAVNQKVALSQLKSLGYAADVVINGREAVAAVEKGQYDLVLMDCQMPEMDGFEATAEIRRFEGDLSHTTIIAMTAHALEGERERCLAAGMDDYISKPVKLETLKQTLKQWLNPVAAVQVGVQPETANVSADNKKHQSVDLSVLNGFRDLQQPNEPDIVTELIDMFLEDADKRISTLKKAVANQEIAKIKEQAHGIKGSSGNIGALQIAVLSEKFEEKNLNITQMKILITEMEVEFQEVIRILTDTKRSG